MPYRQHDWRPLVAGPGANTGIRFNPDGSATVKTVQQDAPTLAHNAVLREMATSDGGFYPGSKREMKRVASIPAGLVAKWLMEEGLDVFNPEHAERVARKLNDPDYAYLRTAPGHLGMIDGGEAFR